MGLFFFIVVLAYLIVLISTTVFYQQDNPDIWSSTVRRLRWSVGRQSLCTPPSSPIMSPKRIGPLPGVTYAPQPVRPIPRPVYHGQPGLGSEYEIERYKSPQNQRMPVSEQMSVEARDSLPEAVPIPLSGQAHVLAARRLPQPPRPPPSPSPPPPAVVRPSGAPPHPIYDSFAAVRKLPSTITYANRPGAQQAEQPAAPSHPSLLGDWPRRDIMEQPVKHKRRTRDTLTSRGSGVPSTIQQTATASVTSADAGHPGRGAPSSAQPLFDEPRARRPSGPRLRIPSNDKDLAVTSQWQVPP